MSEFGTSRDEGELLARLRHGLGESDPVPSDVTDFSKAAFSWRTIDAELAELEFDSVDEDIPAGVRSSATARMVSFQAGQWMLDVEYDEATGRLMGQISPETSYTIELHTSGAFFSAESDDRGRFEADDVVAGPVSLVLRMAGGQVIKTVWVIL